MDCVASERTGGYAVLEAEGPEDGVALGSADGTDDFMAEGGVLTSFVGLTVGFHEGDAEGL